MKKQTNNSNRPERIAAKVQTLTGEILRDKYPDICVTLTGAESHGGLQFVKLFYQGAQESQGRLDEITKTIRFELAAKMNQKYVPEIRFVYDDTLERAARIDELLKEVSDD